MSVIEQFARFFRLDDRLLRRRGLDWLPFFGFEAIGAANLARGRLQHLPHPLGHRRPHHPLERRQVFQ
jgi:hypothetical protein